MNVVHWKISKFRRPPCSSVSMFHYRLQSSVSASMRIICFYHDSLPVLFFYSITQGQEADNHLPLEKISKTAKKCLTKFSPGGIINKLIENSTIQDALVAQLDRVTGYEPVGRGFESLQARQTKRTLHLQCPFSFGALARAGVALCARLCGTGQSC